MIHQPVSRFAQLLLAGQLVRQFGARPQRLAPTGLDVELLDASDRAIATRTPLAVVLPILGSAAPVALGAQAVLRATLNRGQMDVRVGVASAALADRALYDQLALRGQRLATLVPRARLSPGGGIDLVGDSSPSASGRLYLTSDAARLLPLLASLEVVIVDSGATDQEQLGPLLDNARRRAPVVYLTADPFDPALAAVRGAGGLVWSWDSFALGRLSRSRAVGTGGKRLPPLLAAPTMLEAAGASSVAVHVPTAGSELDEALATLWSALGALARAAGTDEIALRGVRWAWGVFNALAMLPVSPSRYDRHVGANPYILSIDSSPDIARQYAAHARAPMRLAWLSVAAEIAAAVAGASASPRERQLTALVADTAAVRRRCIVVRNRIAAAALRGALRESPDTPLGWDERVDVLGLEQLARIAAQQSWDEIVIVGTIPRSRAALLAAPPAARVRVVTCGPAEGVRAVRQALAARSALAALRRETVEGSAPALAIPLAVPAVDEHPADAVCVVEDARQRAVSGKDVAGSTRGVWSPFAVDLLAVLAAVRAEDDIVGHRSASRGPHGAVEVVTVYLDEVGTGERAALLVAPNDLLTRRRGIELRRVAAKALDTGDTVVLVDRAVRRDLRETISAKLAERAEYTALTGLIDLWHERAALAAQTSGLTYREILARMPGTAITSPSTIGTWVNGVVDGPADGQDISRFARAVGDETLEQYAANVVWALRTMHRVDRRLGHWLASRVDAAATSTGDAVVDAELDVHVADLLNSVTDHIVVDIDLRPGRFAPTNMLGVVLPARTADDLIAETPVP